MDHQAVILAAGQGKRLAEATGGCAKCLAEIDGASLLEHHLAMLRGLGFERISIVVGHDADRVRAVAGDSCEFVVNADYAETNSLYSLFLARQTVRGGFLMMNADVLAPRELFMRVMETGQSALTYDSRSGDEPEHMKVEVVDGRLRAISKELPSQRATGENVGIIYFDEPTAQRLFRAAEELVREGLKGTWAPAAVARIAGDSTIRCIDVADLPWVEIDFPEDLAAARESVWPAIAGGAYVNAVGRLNGHPALNGAHRPGSNGAMDAP